MLTDTQCLASKLQKRIMAKQLQLTNFWGKKRRNAPFIWNHFGFGTNENREIVDKSKAVCKHCRAEIKYVQGSTTNMMYHYNLHHLQSSKPSTSLQPNISTALCQPKKYSLTSTRHILLQNLVAEVLIADLLPLSTVSSQLFQKLINTLDPRFQLESRNIYSNVIIPKKYGDIRKSVLELLRPAVAIACTSDSWTSCAIQS